MTDEGLHETRRLHEPLVSFWCRVSGGFARKSWPRLTALAAWAVVSGAVTSSGHASDRPVLNVLAPLGVLSVASVNAFERETAALVRTGFLTSGADTEGRVRNDTTVWDVVLSDELELRKLERIDRLAPIDGSNASRRIVPLFVDPVGLSCRQKRSASASDEGIRWQDLSGSLVAAGFLGELVLALPETVQAILADAVIQPPGGQETHSYGATGRGDPEPQDGKRGTSQGAVPSETRIIFPEKMSAKDPRLAWLGQLYRESRAPVLSVDGEMLNPRVSCVLTQYSKFRRLTSYFPESSPDVLRFYVPDGRTIARRFGVAMTAESPRYTLARRFVDRLVADRQRIAGSSGFCLDGEREGVATDAVCSAKILRLIDEFPVIPPDVAQALEFGHRAVRRRTTEKETGP